MNSLRLKSKRVLLDIDQGQMAERLGITRATYCNKERGKVEFTRSEISEIAKFLNLKLEEVNEIFFDSEIAKCIIREGEM